MALVGRKIHSVQDVDPGVHNQRGSAKKGSVVDRRGGVGEDKKSQGKV